MNRSTEGVMIDRGFDAPFSKEQVNSLCSLFGDQTAVADAIAAIHEHDEAFDLKRGEFYPELLRAVLTLKKHAAAAYGISTSQVQANYGSNGSIDTILAAVKVEETRRQGAIRSVVCTSAGGDACQSVLSCAPSSDQEKHCTLGNLALGLCAVVLLSACSDRDKTTAPATQGSAPAPVVTVRLGVILPETGDLAKYGKTAHAAVQLAVDEINSKPTAGVRFQGVYEDDGLSAEKGLSAARKLINTDKVPILIGPLASTITRAVAPVAQKAGVVLLSPGSSAPGITDAGSFIFRNCLSDEYEGSAMAAFARDRLGLKKVAVFYINNDFGVGLSKVRPVRIDRRLWPLLGAVLGRASRDG